MVEEPSDKASPTQPNVTPTFSTSRKHGRCIDQRVKITKTSR